MLLEEITSADSLEGAEQECKARLDRDNTVGWLKSIAGFANASGGTFYVGVEDKTNKLIGFDRKEADNERNYFNNQVNEHVFPRPETEVHFLKYRVRNNERYILKINVQKSLIKPVILKINQVPAIYIRREGFTGPATYEEIRRMTLESTPVQYDLLDSEIIWKPNYFRKLEQFSEDHDGKTLTEKMLRSMRFMNGKKLLKNGAVLFMDDYNGTKTAVQCSVFTGTTRGSERIVTINRFQGCLTDTINYMMEFVRSRMNHSLIKLADSRINIDAYPERALFEGLINAVAHRDYYLDGTQVQVDIFKDRLEISSPGSIYDGMPLGKTYDLSNIISRRRNELICHVLVACNVMEAAGTGFDKIMEDYRGADEHHRPSIYSASDHFTLILPDLTYIEGVAENDVPVVNFIPVPNGSQYDAKILAYCYQTAHKAQEIAEYLKLTNSTYFRKNILGNLVENQYLNGSKNGRSTYYKSNHNVVKTN